MTEPTIPQDPTFVDFLCFSLDPAFRRLPEAKRKRDIQRFLGELRSKRPEVSFRSYLAIGLRHDTDFFFWAVSRDLAPLQGLAADLMKAGLGCYLRLSHAFVAMTRPSVYNPAHIPAFSDGGGSASGGGKQYRYLFLYPFVKSREWYLLPFEKRREMMRAHMAIGEEYPMVRLNTTYSFGLGDQDFVLAFETDQPAAFEDLVQRLRETEASRYTVRDTPFILGISLDNPEQLIVRLGL
ncbi:MAG: chlorite dismutase family protein [Candidatus Omnitrophica bacterium]|nr:chlorite dismutase family protein [Candidatus Omnitrophota bacterium]